jgi:hypothetical protein
MLLRRGDESGVRGLGASRDADGPSGFSEHDVEAAETSVVPKTRLSLDFLTFQTICDDVASAVGAIGRTTQ